MMESFPLFCSFLDLQQTSHTDLARPILHYKYLQFLLFFFNISRPPGAPVAFTWWGHHYVVGIFRDRLHQEFLGIMCASPLVGIGFFNRPYSFLICGGPQLYNSEALQFGIGLWWLPKLGGPHVHMPTSAPETY